ncbi:MAG TPA: hypothetical protein VGQ25_11265, partial [Gemmatimonadales bacterium]|nr:hypothetical protein [Gemmatimonadales bacterium]
MQPLGGRQPREDARDYWMSTSLQLKLLVPEDIRLHLARDPRLLIPVGTCEQHGPHLALGCD